MKDHLKDSKCKKGYLIKILRGELFRYSESPIAACLSDGEGPRLVVIPRKRQNVI